MVAFQWDAPCSIWIHGSWVRAFLRFQPCFRHALSHCECSKICPKLPKVAQKQLAWGTLKCHQNLRFSYFSLKKISTCSHGTKAYAHHLDFQKNNFLYIIFYCQKMALVCEFQHTPLWKMIFFQCSTPFVDMRFWDMYLTYL
jgi:hypothetical protein